MIILSCKDICKSYGIRDVLKNITFSINEGDKVGIIGANGEGKSTLFKIITKELSQEGFKGISSKITDYKKLSEELGIGEITLKDIVKELEKPGRDPREDLPKPILRTDVLEMKDLKPGMKLKGTVRNVIDFGAFVDIGVHQDGLVHISQMADRFIKHPLEVVSVGDVVDVVVVSVDIDKKRIQLSMKL